MVVSRSVNGDWERAREVHRRLYPLSASLFIETNPIPVKTALGIMKKIRPELRLPLCEMGGDNQKKLRQEMKKCGVIS